jgi:uncharacterized protein
MRAIADTGFLVAFGNRRDHHHAWALNLSRQIREPLLTCEAVLSEATFYLNDAQLVLDYINDGLVRVDFALRENLPRITQLARKFQDRSPDLADLCLIRMSELNPNLPILTTDLADFRVYRRNQRDRIPLIHP